MKSLLYSEHWCISVVVVERPPGAAEHPKEMEDIRPASLGGKPPKGVLGGLSLSLLRRCI